jgi:hypothetical protein
VPGLECFADDDESPKLDIVRAALPEGSGRVTVAEEKRAGRQRIKHAAEGAEERQFATTVVTGEPRV